MTEETAAPPPRPPWRREMLIFLALCVLAVAGVALWLLLRDDDNGDRTTMPAVIGMQQAEAVRRVQAAGLKPNVEPKRSDAPANQVVSQDPGAGVQLKEGEEVVLGVSSGGGTTTVTETETTTVTKTQTSTQTQTQTQTATVSTVPASAAIPDVTGQPLASAVQTLADAGFLPQSYPVASSDPRGTVVAQNPTAGTNAPTDRPIRVNVSLGSGARGTTPVPDLTGPEAREALVTCAAKNVTCRVLFAAAPKPDNVGEVVDQKPAAGATVPFLSQLTLYVGR